MVPTMEFVRRSGGLVPAELCSENRQRNIGPAAVTGSLRTVERAQQPHIPESVQLMAVGALRAIYRAQCGNVFIPQTSTRG